MHTTQCSMFNIVLWSAFFSITFSVFTGLFLLLDPNLYLKEWDPHASLIWTIDLGFSNTNLPYIFNLHLRRALDRLVFPSLSSQFVPYWRTSRASLPSPLTTYPIGSCRFLVILLWRDNKQWLLGYIYWAWAYLSCGTLIRSSLSTDSDIDLILLFLLPCTATAVEHHLISCLIEGFQDFWKGVHV